MPAVLPLKHAGHRAATRGRDSAQPRIARGVAERRIVGGPSLKAQGKSSFCFDAATKVGNDAVHHHPT
jgi:hypothetical protein